jgi:histidinol phosphatase-like enzyme|tara:strand:- start:715 stop:1011 length:297 start_codon:yes stop_codon:yes gene_type:complete
MLVYFVDIDNTICESTNSDYNNSIPLKGNIKKINHLYDNGNRIIYWTARGSNSGIDWSDFTEKQLNEWNVKYHELKMNKPHYDVWIDDKAINSIDYFK